ncbi:hypothetical protein CC86DRAFT_422053 [Ophiobolus disseminans]|uniref:Uncharacterized protein n=1 Tax=Ophiobolus disseminans TaxID=1469910 RepID=A0A6A6ZRP2_9PLEO|nr:hypothetical protein CC86DRAFT_422053 [Ophiobolus disseminans]
MSSTTKPSGFKESAPAACANQSTAKKVKVAPGGQVKQLAATLIANKASTSSQSTAGSKAQGIATPKQKVIAKETATASLQRMKEEALVTLKRRKSLYDVLHYIVAVNKPSVEGEEKNPLEKSIAILVGEIKAMTEDISKLKLFGRGFALDKISNLDAQAIVALASWGSNEGKASKPNKQKRRISSQTRTPTRRPLSRNLAQQTSPHLPLNTSAPLPEPRPTSSAEDENLFTNEDTNNTPSIKESRATKLPPAPPQPQRASSSSLPKLPPKPRPTSSAFMKPKRPTGPISRPVRAIQVDKAKNKTTEIIDAGVALEAQQRGTAAEKKQKNNGGFFAKGADNKHNSRMKTNDDGYLIFRKKARETVVGEKRKRGDGLEKPRKRVAVEGRSFAPLRTRRALFMAEAMDVDDVAVRPAAASSLAL